MDERTTVILETFNEWALACKAEHDQRWGIELTQLVDQAYSAAKEAAEIKSDSFHEEAKDYFRMQAYINLVMVEHQQNALNRHQNNWSKISLILDENIDTSAALDKIYNIDWKVGKEATTMLGKNFDLPSLRNFLILFRHNEYEKEFGMDAIYLQVGKDLSIRHMKSEVRTRGRRGKHPVYNNLDTKRASTFVRVTNEANLKLLQSDLKLTNTTQVVDTILGRNLNQYPAIDWCLENYFQAKSISRLGLNNSISRGKTTLKAGGYLD